MENHLNFVSALKRAAPVFLLILLMCAPAMSQEELVLTLGQQKTILAPNVARVAVGNPRVADVKALTSSKQILVTAVGVGRTNVLIWDRKNNERSVPILVLSRDLNEVINEVRGLLGAMEGIEVKAAGTRVVINGAALRTEDLKRIEKIADMYPQVTNLVTLSPVVLDIITNMINEELKRAGMVNVWAQRMGGQILLDGDVASEIDKEKAQMIASAYTPNTKSFIKVGVMLDKMVNVSVDFVEVSKGAEMNLGVNWGDALSFGGELAAGGGLQGALTGAYKLAAGKLAGAIKMNQGNNMCRVLYQPKLLCRSGNTAKFLAGGEVPIPIVTAETTSVEYKNYGLILNISPVVDKHDNVSLKIEIENSTIAEYSPQGLPNFRTSRVETVVNLKSGETVALSGLVRSEDSKAVSKVPGLGSIPVLGELFKSRDFKDGKSQLLVFVTPQMVVSSDTKESIADIKDQYDSMGSEFKFKLMD